MVALLPALLLIAVGALPAVTGSDVWTVTSFTLGGASGVAVLSTGDLVVSDGCCNIYRATTAGVATLLAGSGTSRDGDGIGAAAGFYQPRQLAVDLASNTVYVAEPITSRIAKITAAGTVTSINPTLVSNGAAWNSPKVCEHIHFLSSLHGVPS